MNTFRLLPPSKSKRKSAVSKLMSLSTSMRRVVFPLVFPVKTSISADPMSRLPVARIVRGAELTPLIWISESPRSISPPAAFTVSKVRERNPTISVPSSPKKMSPASLSVFVPARSVSTLTLDPEKSRSPSLGAISKTIWPALSTVSEVSPVRVSNHSSPITVVCESWTGLVMSVGAMFPSTMVTVIGSSRNSPCSP